MIMSAPTNRRRHVRVRPKQLVTRVRAGDDLHVGLGIENISMGGAFVRCNMPMKVGREVTLEVTRAGASQLLQINGKVTSSVNVAVAAATHRTAGMGISFNPLPAHVQQRLEGLILSIDPGAMKQPAAQRVARSSVLGESTELTPRHVPNEIYVQVGKAVLDPTDQLRADLEERDQRILELESENKKLRQRLLNLVNHG